MKFDLIVADPPWSFDDKLTMSDVARGAESQYPVLDNQEIIRLDVKSISQDNGVLALWVPSSLLQIGLDTMSAWGFRQTQTYIWVKVKKNAVADLRKFLLESKTDEFNYQSLLAFGMGRLFRQCHELALLGVKGKVYKDVIDKSQRSVIIEETDELDVDWSPNLKHSQKPDSLQISLKKLFPKSVALEMFARRELNGYTCVGNELPSTLNEDIRDSIIRLSSIHATNPPSQ